MEVIVETETVYRLYVDAPPDMLEQRTDLGVWAKHDVGYRMVAYKKECETIVVNDGDEGSILSNLFDGLLGEVNVPGSPQRCKVIKSTRKTAEKAGWISAKSSSES